MAQTQIRKGFFFYFGLLVLLLLAIFLVLLVVMMFNPGKTILWMQYFAGNQYVQVETTTDTNASFDLNSVTKVQVNATYANIFIQKDSSLNKSCIDITNNAKGFTGANGAKQFSYSVVMEDGVLKIDIVEPTGFIYLSKDIQIKINLAKTDYNFANTDFKVNTEDGVINVGGTSREGALIAPKKLDLTTTSGTIIFTSYGNTSACTQISLNTDNGNIMANGRNVVDGQGIVTDAGDITISTNKGTITLDNLKANGGNVNLVSDRGKFVIGNLKGDAINIDCREGNFELNDVQGNIYFTASEDKINSPNIFIRYLNGDFSLTANKETNSKPKVEIYSIKGNFTTFGTNGDFKIDYAYGSVVITSGSGNIDVAFSKNVTTTAVDTIITDSANVKITSYGVFSHTINVTTNSGKITFNVTKDMSFDCNMYINDEEGKTLLEDAKININIGHVDVKNPLHVVGGGSKSSNIEIKTNSTVEFNLIEVPI